MEKFTLQAALGQRCRELRALTHESQVTFAYRIGMDRTQYWAIENGRRNPNLATLARIAAGFGITLSELLRSVGDTSGFES